MEGLLLKRYIFLLAFVFVFSVQSHAFAKEFKDVPKSHAYYDEIQYLTKSGIITGHLDGTFKPNDYITNRQVATMIVRLLDAHDLPYRDADERYIDVTKKDYAFKDISIALDLGLMRTKYSGSYDLFTGKLIEQGWKFFPNHYITREDMAFTLASALFITGNEDITFADTKGDSLNEPEISVLADNNIVTGFTKDEFKPKQPITRAHFAVIMYRAMQVLEKQDTNLLDKFALHEAVAPLGDYIQVAHEKGSVYDFAYDRGRYAILSSNNSSIRFMDMNTLKTTPEWSDGSIVDIHGNLAVWLDDQTGPIYMVDLLSKAKKVQTIELSNMEVSGLHFSEDGQFLFLEKSSELELLPQQMYDMKNKRFIEIPYYEVSLTDWENGELYFWGMSDFDYVEKSEDGYSITNMVKGLYAYNPTTNQTRTIYEESMDTLDYRTFTTPYSFDVYQGLGVVSTDSGIQRIDLQTGQMTSIPSDTSSDTPVAIADNYLYYVEGAAIIKQSLSTYEKEEIHTFTEHPSLQSLTFSIEGNHLFVHGTGVPMTFIRIK